MLEPDLQVARVASQVFM